MSPAVRLADARGLPLTGFPSRVLLRLAPAVDALADLDEVGAFQIGCRADADTADGVVRLYETDDITHAERVWAALVGYCRDNGGHHKLDVPVDEPAPPTPGPAPHVVCFIYWAE